MTKKLLTLFIVTTMTILSFTSCGKNKDIETNVQLGVNGYIYTPEYIELPKDDDESLIQNVQIHNNYLYYSVINWDEETGRNERYYKKAIEGNSEAEEVSLSVDSDGFVTMFLFGENDETYVFLNKSDDTAIGAEGFPSTLMFLQKYDAQGNQIYSTNITEYMGNDNFGFYIKSAVVDTAGRIAAVVDSKILLFNADGKYKGEITTNSWINTICVDKEDNFYTIQNSQEGGMELASIDFERNAYKDTYKNIPSSKYVIAGENKEFIVCSDSKVYKYSMETQTAEEILDWLDSDVNAQYIQGFDVMEDGRIVVYIRDWSDGGSELAVLTKTKVEDVPQKEIIVIGTMSQDQNLQREAVNFNKTNNKYKIKIKTYIDYNADWHENIYKDALTILNNEITSGNGPDIINLSYGIDMETFANKGLFADLLPFLDKSESLKKEDFIENILEEYTINEKLVAIPCRFNVQVALGKTSMVGDKKGWSVSDLIAFSKENPEIEIFEHTSKISMLNMLIRYNQDSFINYEEGKCNFDSDEFKSIVEFANGFPSENHYDEDEKGRPYKLQDDELLLSVDSIYNIEELQLYKLMFDSPSICVGFPTVDGSYLGSILNTAGNTYAISTQSKNQEGAWTYIENTLLSDDVSKNGFNHGFPTQKVLLEKLFEESMEPDYVLDQNGEQLLKEDGTPMVSSHSYSWNNWNTEILPATQELVDEMCVIIGEAKLVPDQDNQILSMIMEDVAPYFEGQKSLDEVVNIIQSRVQLYVSEIN